MTVYSPTPRQSRDERANESQDEEPGRQRPERLLVVEGARRRDRGTRCDLFKGLLAHVGDNERVGN